MQFKEFLAVFHAKWACAAGEEGKEAKDEAMVEATQASTESQFSGTTEPPPPPLLRSSSSLSALERSAEKLRIDAEESQSAKNQRRYRQRLISGALSISEVAYTGQVSLLHGNFGIVGDEGFVRLGDYAAGPAVSAFSPRGVVFTTGTWYWETTLVDLGLGETGIGGMDFLRGCLGGQDGKGITCASIFPGHHLERAETHLLEPAQLWWLQLWRGTQPVALNPKISSVREIDPGGMCVAMKGGDVLGILVNVDAGAVVYYLNGHMLSLPIVHDTLTKPMFPAVTISNRFSPLMGGDLRYPATSHMPAAWRINFGSIPTRFGPPLAFPPLLTKPLPTSPALRSQQPPAPLSEGFAEGDEVMDGRDDSRSSNTSNSSNSSNPCWLLLWVKQRIQEVMLSHAGERLGKIEATSGDAGVKIVEMGDETADGAGGNSEYDNSLSPSREGGDRAESDEMMDSERDVDMEGDGLGGGAGKGAGEVDDDALDFPPRSVAQRRQGGGGNTQSKVFFVETTKRAFPSVIASGVALTWGRWYYEVELVEAGIGQIGFADMAFVGASDDGHGVGDDIHSWAYDGQVRCLWLFRSTLRISMMSIYATVSFCLLHPAALHDMVQRETEMGFSVETW